MSCTPAHTIADLNKRKTINITLFHLGLGFSFIRTAGTCPPSVQNDWRPPVGAPASKGSPALHKSRDHPAAARADPRVHRTPTGKATAVSGRPSPWGTSGTGGHSSSPPPVLLASTGSGHVWPGTFLPPVSLSFDSGPALFAGKITGS